MVLVSSDAEYFCNYPDLAEPIWIPYLWLTRPDGTIKEKYTGDYYTRAFVGLTPDDFEIDWGCTVWNSTDAMIAEGISHATWVDNHWNAYSAPHKRRNSIGLTLNGVLYDLVGMCKNGMVKLHHLYREILPKDFPECLPDSCEGGKVLRRGPYLNCPR